MTKPTQDKETLRKAVARAICMTLYGEEIRDALLISPLERSECFDSADAAIATMFERLRDLPPSIYDGPDQYVRKADVLAAFQQENSDGR